MEINKKDGGGTVVVGRAIAWNATDASVDDTVDGSFGLRVDVLAGRYCVSLLWGKRKLRGLDVRLTAKHVGGTVVVVVVGRAIARNATDTSLDDTVEGSFGLRVDVLAGRCRVSLLWEKQRQLGLDWRLTTKHVDGTVVVVVVVVVVVGGGGVGVGCAIALKATDASVDGIFDVVLAGLGPVVRCVAVKSNLLKRASLASNC